MKNPRFPNDHRVDCILPSGKVIKVWSSENLSNDASSWLHSKARCPIHSKRDRPMIPFLDWLKERHLETPDTYLRDWEPPPNPYHIQCFNFLLQSFYQDFRLPELIRMIEHPLRASVSQCLVSVMCNPTQDRRICANMADRMKEHRTPFFDLYAEHVEQWKHFSGEYNFPIKPDLGQRPPIWEGKALTLRVDLLIYFLTKLETTK